MGAMIFLMVVVMFVGGITAIVFGIQVMLDHAKGKPTAWSKRTGKLCIILGFIAAVLIGGMLTIVIFDL